MFSSLRSRAAFTLIELLTVIAIIAILMGLLFPAFGAIKENAKKTQAKSDIVQIVAAVTNYYTEYSKYPVPDINTPGNSEDVLYGDKNNGGTHKSMDLFDTLRAIGNGTGSANRDNVQNPRRIVYYNGNIAKDPTTPRAGFDTNGNLFDPWAHTYVVGVDSTYDEVTAPPDLPKYTDLSTSYVQAASGGQTGVRAPVIAYSFGRDGLHGTKGNKQFANSDDVVSYVQ